MIIRRSTERVEEYVQKTKNHDLLLNKAMRETLPEDMLAVYNIFTDDWTEMAVIIAPVSLMRDYQKKMDIPDHIRHSNTYDPDRIYVYIPDEDFHDFDYTRFLSNQYIYFGDKLDDVVLDMYISKIEPYEDDTPILKLLKRAMNETVHIVTDDKHKSYLTQIYSRIRRTHCVKEDKSSLYNKMKLIEQFAEAGYIELMIRDDKGKLISIKERIF